MAREVERDPGLEIVDPLETIGRQDDAKTPRPIYSMTITVNFLLEECVGVKEAQFMLGLAWSNYAYALLQKGALEGVEIACKGHDKWFITKESVAYYKEHTLRSKKLRRYDLRIHKDDEDKLRSLMTGAGIDYKLEIAYKAPRHETEGGE